MARDRRYNNPGQPLAGATTSPPHNVHADGMIKGPDPTPQPVAGDTSRIDELGINHARTDVHARLARMRHAIQKSHEALSSGSNEGLEQDEEDRDDEGSPTRGQRIVTLHANRPFRFLFKGGERLIPAGQNVFDLDDPADAAFLAHTYISRDLADGALEHPKVTSDRLQAQADASAQRAVEHKARLAEAQAAIDSFSAGVQRTEAISQAQHDEMNTPINQLNKPKG